MDTDKITRIGDLQKKLSELQAELSASLLEAARGGSPITLDDLDLSIKHVEEAIDAARPVRHIR